MAFKHKIPLPAFLLGLLAVGLVTIVLLHTPPDEDLIRQAVERYVAGLGPVQQMEIHGTVADILLKENGRLIYAEFEKKDGVWTYARNLAEEFTRQMKDPEVQRGIFLNLGEKVSKRLQTASLKMNEGIPMGFDLARDRETHELVGQVLLRFAYPKVGDRQMRGEYVERFEWKGGRWQSLGPGSLYDAVDR